jgi:carbon-monoxide dehydrogenase large subunit
MVIACDARSARDAAESVAVEYEELPAVVSASAALADGAPRLFECAPGNLALHWSGGDEAATERAFASADHVVRARLVNNRVVVAPMETRGVLASYDPGSRRYTLHAPSQGANQVKAEVARTLGVPERDVRVITPDVGGAFGIKIPAYPEYILAAWVARVLGRPVKWIGERGDAFLTDGQGRDHVMEGELALSRDGDFLAIRCRTLSNCGAYGSGTACTIPTAGGTRCMTGVYRIPAWHADVRVVYTNTVPVIAYRGAGKPEYNYMVERLVDKAARTLSIDPVSLRRRNAVSASEMPYVTGTGLTFDSGDFAGNMDDALALADRAGFETRRERSRARGRLRGQGLAMFQEPDGFLDNRVTVVFGGDGGLSVTLTGQSGGQGFVTTFAQVAAQQLGLPVGAVRVVQGDSDIIGPGRGTGGSRTATVAGNGILQASERIIDKARRIAAHMFEASEQDVVFEDGVLRIVGTDLRRSLQEVAAASFDAANLPAGMEPGLEATVHYMAREYNYPCGCHVCEVEIDAETGSIEIVDYVAVNDHGVVINPMLLEGQIHGGVVQGIGQALLEHCAYDEDSGQLLAGSFMDYCLPRASDLPALRIRRNVVPARTNALGVKGVGESGCTAACPALVNAVVDALACEGIDEVDMPVCSEQVWRLLNRR